MHKILIFTSLLFLANNTNAQIVNLAKRIYQIQDTSIEVCYFKDIDSILKNKIDSFYCMAKSKNIDTSGGGFLNINFFVKNKKLQIGISFESTSGSYNFSTNEDSPYFKVLGFGFHKSILIIFTFNNYLTKLKSCHNSNLYKKIVFKNLPIVEQEAFIKDPNSFRVQIGPSIIFHID